MLHALYNIALLLFCLLFLKQFIHLYIIMYYQLSHARDQLHFICGQSLSVHSFTMKFMNWNFQNTIT